MYVSYHFGTAICLGFPSLYKGSTSSYSHKYSITLRTDIYLSPVATKLRKGDIRPSGLNNLKSFTFCLSICPSVSRPKFRLDKKSMDEHHFHVYYNRLPGWLTPKSISSWTFYPSEDSSYKGSKSALSICFD